MIEHLFSNCINVTCLFFDSPDLLQQTNTCKFKKKKKKKKKKKNKKKKKKKRTIT